MSLNLPVTLVIPILNEAASLPELLGAVKAQSQHPDEIIFSDAGSTDGSQDMISAWWKSEGWAEADCRVLSLPGAMPGAGRNAGVRAARNTMIAFIDGGITPAHDWLAQLWQQHARAHPPGVFGVCHFSATDPFAKAICALSYGHGAVHPVNPISLFERRVFLEIGDFPEHLRAGEDLLWVSAYQARYGQRDVCPTARVTYTHFPGTWKQALKKWRITERHCVVAGVRTSQQAVYLFALPTLYGLAIFASWPGLAILVAYLILRGIIDPARRSADRPWWRGRPSAALIAPVLAAALDIAKWAGILEGIAVKTCKKNKQKECH